MGIANGHVAAKRRGARSNRVGRCERYARDAFDDGWEFSGDDGPKRLNTEVEEELSRTVISRNTSPDIPFDLSVNPYRGCEHGCVYCYARQTHCYLGLSAGLDFESRLFAKSNAPEVLAKALRKPGYRPQAIMLGANTDAYQPIERNRQITREILKVLDAFNHPVAITTKSPLVTRDIDILAPMAERRLVSVGVSITSLDIELVRNMEPRAASPRRRLETIRALSEAGIPVTAVVAPVIPSLNDHELETILSATAGAGAVAADYSLLRLPLEVKELFVEWLREHAEDKSKRVLNRLRESRDGHLYVSNFETRMKGTGEYAELLARRFRLACRRLGITVGRPAGFELDTGLFHPPPATGEQLSLL
jgi:DNA repair photolyase